jgi:hypothetical protein
VIKGLQQVLEKWVERCKKRIVCQGRYFEKVPSPHLHKIPTRSTNKVSPRTLQTALVCEVRFSKIKKNVMLHYDSFNDRVNLWDSVTVTKLVHIYDGVTKSFRTDRLERALRMEQLSATRCSCIAILWVSLVSFAAITLCVASQLVFIITVVYFVTDSVRKLLDIPSYTSLSKVTDS